MIITADKNPNGYNVLQVIDVIKSLATSRGFYARILEDILDAKENNPAYFEYFTEVVEKQNFKDPLDVVMFFEC